MISYLYINQCRQEELVIENVSDLELLKAVDPRTVDRATLVDIRDISVKDSLPMEERMADFLEQIKNPYLCKCGDIVVQSVFADTHVTLTDRLKQYFKLV